MSIEKEFDTFLDIFNNELIIDEMLEDLKREMLEVIMSKELSVFKKTIFIQGVFAYANLILSNNSSLSLENKNKKLTEIVEMTNLLGDEILNNTENIKIN